MAVSRSTGLRCVSEVAVFSKDEVSGVGERGPPPHCDINERTVHTSVSKAPDSEARTRQGSLVSEWGTASGTSGYSDHRLVSNIPRERGMMAMLLSFS